MLDELVGFRTVCCAQFFRVPFNFLAHTESDVSQQTGFRQRSGVIEIRSCRAAGFAGFDPFVMVADGIGNKGCGCYEILKVLFRQETVFAVARLQFPL